MKPIILIAILSSLSFANILPRLLSLEVSGKEVQPGDRIYLHYRFQNVGSEEEENYKIFVHARIKGTDEGFGGDFSPFYPTSRWRRGEIIEENSVLNIPDDAKKGEYVVYIGFYSDEGRIEMDNKEIERDGFRYEVFSFEIGDKTIEEKRAFIFREPLKLEGIKLRERKIYLENERLFVALEDNYPLIREIRDKKTGEIFSGSDVEADFQLGLISPQGQIAFAPSSRFILDIKAKKEGNKVVYKLGVKEEGREVISLSIAYELREKSLRASWKVEKKGDYHLQSLRLPLLSLEKAKMVLPLMEGRLVDCDKSFSHREILGIECWRSPITYSSLYGDKGLALLDISSVEDKVWGEVRNGKGLLGVIFNCHSPTNPPLFLQDSSSAEIHFIEGDWIASAHFIQENIKEEIRNLYKNSIVYKIFCDVPQAERPVTTFEEAMEIIKRIYHLTGGMRQIVYLVGWQYYGHDTGYPAIDKVNERIGGREGLLNLIEEGRKYNAIVSFHDNYDDAYMDSPAWNEDFICRLPNGELVKGGIWAGGQSYIINPKRYVEGGYAKTRIEHTLKLYPLRESYHIDVLSAVPLRYSYSYHTCTGKESVEYKKKIVEMFREKGVDVTSELVTQPFLGFMSYFYHLVSSDDNVRKKFFSSEDIIPFVPACIHGKAIYGQKGYWGGVPSMDVTKDNWKEFIRLIFLEVLPSLLFAEELIRDFREDKVYYPSGWWNKDNEVFYKGMIIRKQGNVFIPRDNNRWFLYSNEGGEVEWDIPKGWKDFQVYRLYEDGREEIVNVKVKGGKFRFEAEKQVVYEVIGK